VKFKEIGLQPPHNLVKYLNNIVATENDPTLLVFHEETPYYDLSARYIQYGRDDDYWNYLNAEIIETVFGRICRLRGEFDRRGQMRVSERKSTGSLQFEEVFRRDDLVSTRFLIYTDYAGAAHAGRWTKTKNFFGPTAGKLVIGDLFSPSDEALKYIAEYVVLDLRRQGGDDLRKPAEGPLKELIQTANSMEKWEEKQKLWNLYAQFNFDLAGITFNFSPATIPGFGWAAGEFIVRVPWDALIGFLNPMLKEGPVGALLSQGK
jgi:hypothetical protein